MVPISQQPLQRVRVAPVNPALIMRMRDPRFMKMQQAAAAAAAAEKVTTLKVKQETSATMAIGGPHSFDGPRFVPTISADSAVAAVEHIPTVSQLNKNMKEMIQKEAAEASRSSKNTSPSSKRSPTKPLSRSTRTGSSTSVGSSRTSSTSNSSHRTRRDSREVRDKMSQRLKQRTFTSPVKESTSVPPKKPNVVPKAEVLSEKDKLSEAPAIKFTKVSTRNRNYMARNRDASQSPPAAPSFFTDNSDLQPKIEVPPAPEITAEDIKPLTEVSAIEIQTADDVPEPALIPDLLTEPVTPEQSKDTSTQLLCTSSTVDSVLLIMILQRLLNQKIKCVRLTTVSPVFCTLLKI